MSPKHSETVKQNFEQKAAEYDAFMLECVPYYDEIVHQMIDALPFNSSTELNICDLGSGTGNVTQLLLDRFTNAKINCIDISPMMTDMAKAKLHSTNVNFEIADFYDYEFNQPYDIIISSLALHHLVSDDDKKEFYKKIYNALKPGGIFLNADVVLAASTTTESNYMEQWKEWLRQFHSEEDLMEMVVNRYYEEDKPTNIMNHLLWMHEIGFKEIDVIYKKMKVAVYCGSK